MVNSSVFNATSGSYVEGTVAANKVVLGINGNNKTATFWAYNDKTNVYVVDKDYKTITVSSVANVDTDANDLVYASYTTEGKQKKLADVVIVEQDDVAVAVPTINTIKVNGSAVTAYATAEKAAENAIEVPTNSSVTVAATVTGATPVYELDGAFNGTFVKDYDIADYTVGSTENEICVTKVTATNDAGEVTAYVAVKVVTMYTLTVKTASDKAMVTIDSKDYTVDTTGKEISVKADSIVTVTVTSVSGSHTLASTTAALGSTPNADLWSNGAQSWKVSTFTGNAELTLTLA